MSENKVKIIIGSNYGDEGKGMATRFFSDTQNGLCLNVLFNGGCQRGHTVELKDGTRHVFQHFGSGTLDCSYTYFDQNFIINPAIFMREYNELSALGVHPIGIVSPDCRINTLYDMFINQIVETHRAQNRHGSCGYGIWETQKRYEYTDYAIPYGETFFMTDKELSGYLQRIASVYLPQKLLEYGIDEIPQNYKDLIKSKGLIDHFVRDLRKMQLVTTMSNFNEIANHFETIVFEGAQGLELDEKNENAFPHVTASDTTSLVPIQRVLNMDCDIEICYVTRTYFTRHGAGLFPTECDKSDINKDITDKTNSYNDYQQSIRYGKFDIKEFLSRVLKDKETVAAIRPDLKTSLLITHLNYTNGDMAGNCTIKDLAKHFDKIYLSHTKFSEDITSLCL